MRTIGRNIRSTVKQGNSFPATVTDIQNNRVTVRLSGNGALYRSIKLVGGPVTVGQQVMVDFTTNEPTVVAPGVPVNIPATPVIPRSARPRPPSETDPLRPMGDAIWLTDIDDNVVGSATGYSIDHLGLAAALNQIYEFQYTPGYDNEIYTIWIPTATINMASVTIESQYHNVGPLGGIAFPQRTRVIGMGAEYTILAGGHIILDNQFYIQDVGFTVSATYNPTGSEDPYYEHVTLHGDGTFQNVHFTGSITGTGKMICLGNLSWYNCHDPENPFTDDFPSALTSWPASVRLYSCTISSSHYGIYFNRIREGYGGVQYFPFAAPDNMPPTTVELTDSSGSSGSSALDPEIVQWMHFKPVLTPSGNNVDGFAIGISGRRYQNAGAKVYLEIEIGSDPIGCLDLTSWTSGDYLDLSPRMDTTDCLITIYDPTTDVEEYTARMRGPTIPHLDQGQATFVNGQETFFRVQEGDLVTWRFTNMAYGLGSNWDDEAFIPYPDCLPWTAAEPSNQEMFVAHFNRAYGDGSPARYNQQAMSFYARVSRCYVLLPDGYKIWLAPSRVRAELHNTTVTAVTQKIAGKNAEVLVDDPSLVSADGITHLYDAPGLVVSPDPPSVSWPGRMWFQTGG